MNQSHLELTDRFRKPSRSLEALEPARERLRGKLLAVEANGSQREATDEEGARYWRERGA